MTWRATSAGHLLSGEADAAVMKEMCFDAMVGTGK